MSKACCFTGHRNMEAAETAKIEIRLREEIQALIARGFTIFYAGGAVGFDTLAAKTVLSLREVYPDVHLRLLLPCPGQESKWNLRDRHAYHRILEAADSAEYVSQTYSTYAMLKRNRELVNRSQYCISYLKKEKGGTAFTVRYAEKSGIRVKNICQEEQTSLFAEEL